MRVNVQLDWGPVGMGVLTVTRTHFFISLLCFFQPVHFILSDWPLPFGWNHSRGWLPSLPAYICIIPSFSLKHLKDNVDWVAFVRRLPTPGPNRYSHERGVLWWQVSWEHWLECGKQQFSAWRKMLASLRKGYWAKKTKTPTMVAWWLATSKPNQQCYKLLLNNYIFFSSRKR